MIPAILLPALGAVVGLLTQVGVDQWYQTIARSILTPPDWVFGAVWTTLYLMMGLSLGLILSAPDPDSRKSRLLVLFFLQLVLNLAWSFVFFQLHWLWLSAIWVAALAGVVMVLIIQLWPVSRLAATLLIPYILWLGFALYLSTTIALLNPSHFD